MNPALLIGRSPVVRWTLMLVGLIILVGAILLVVVIVRWWKNRDAGYVTPEGALSEKRWWHLTQARI